MAFRVRPPDGRTDFVAQLPHIAGAEPTRRAGKPGDGGGLSQPLQIQRYVETSRAEFLAKRAEIFDKAAEGFEFLLLEQQNFVNIRIIHEQLPRRRLHRPRHPRLGKRLLDRVGHRQRVDHVADGAELDNQDVHDPLLILSITVVVDRPSTKGISSTRPPAAWTIFASGSASSE